MDKENIDKENIENKIILKLKNFTKEMFSNNNSNIIIDNTYLKKYTNFFKQYEYSHRVSFPDLRFFKSDEKVGFYILNDNTELYDISDLINNRELNTKLIKALNKKYNKYFNIFFIEK